MFLAILNDREDGDYDTVAAVSIETLGAAKIVANIMFTCKLLFPQDTFSLKFLENVTDVVSGDLTGL
jgi:hypothetical protein